MPKIPDSDSITLNIDKFPHILSQIAESVAATNLKVVAEAPALSIAQALIAASQANAVLFANMVQSQQQHSIGAQNALIAKLLGKDGE